MRSPTITTDSSLLKLTRVSMKWTVTPTSVIAAIESKLTPRPGTYRTVSINAVRFVSPISVVNSMLPIPWTASLASPIPFTNHVPGVTGVKVLKNCLWSDMCCVAPESANQSWERREMKQVECEIKLWSWLVPGESLFDLSWVELVFVCCEGGKSTAGAAPEFFSLANSASCRFRVRHSSCVWYGTVQ